MSYSQLEPHKKIYDAEEENHRKGFWKGFVWGAIFATCLAGIIISMGCSSTKDIPDDGWERRNWGSFEGTTSQPPTTIPTTNDNALTMYIWKWDGVLVKEAVIWKVH